MIDFDTFKNCLRLLEIWANKLLPKALKSCPKSNKSPNLVTLLVAWKSEREGEGLRVVGGSIERQVGGKA